MIVNVNNNASNINMGMSLSETGMSSEKVQEKFSMGQTENQVKI